MDYLFGRVFSKETSIHAPVLLSKHLTFVTGQGTKYLGNYLKARVALMEQSIFKAVINLVEVSQLVNLPALNNIVLLSSALTILNSNGTSFRKTQKSKLIEKLFLVDPKKSAGTLYHSSRNGHDLVVGHPSAEDRWTGTQYKWSDFM